MNALPRQAFEAVLDNIRYYIHAVDPKTGKIIYANRTFISAFGEDAVGGDSQEYIPLSDDKINRDPDWPLRAEDLPQGDDLTFYDVYLEDKKQWLSVSRQLARWVDGEPVYLINCYDNTAHKRYVEEIRSQSCHDFLTGLPNRRSCEESLREMLMATAKVLSPGCLFFIDLDDFKVINDSHGHDYGDAVLVSFADFLRRTFSGKNKIFRFGGDEFVVMISHENYLNMPEYLDAMFQRAKSPWRAEDKEFYCSLSIGVVEFVSRMEYSGSILKKADIAMYHAKKMGKNCYACYTEGMDRDTILRSTMEPLLRRAMRNDFKGFEILYQPYCSAGDNKIIGAEALLRLKGESGNLLLPKDFIDLLGYLGLIVPVNEHVLAKSAALCREINKTRPAFSMTVNLSPVQFKQKDSVERIERVLRQSGVDLGNIVVAINEKVSLDERRHMLDLCAELRGHGIRVALDDFGLGNASFINMRRLPVDIIKIAPDFLKETRDEFMGRLLRLIVELGHVSDKLICMNGVETAEQMEFSRSRGADLAQGFFLYTPGDAKILRALLKNT